MKLKTGAPDVDQACNNTGFEPMRNTIPAPESLQPLPSTAFHILLALKDRARHGYGILKAVERTAEKKLLISTGTLYSNMRGLLEDKLITVVSPAEAAENNPAEARYNGITDRGQQILHAELKRIEEAAPRATRQKPAYVGVTRAWGKMR